MNLKRQILKPTIKKIKKNFGEIVKGINYIVIDENNIHELITDIETPAFGYEKKLVIVKSSGLFKKEGKRAEIGFLADQSPLPDALNYWTTFLNQNTAVIDSIERIARKLDYAVCYFDVTRESRGVYKIVVKLITDDISSTPQNYVTEQYTRLLEETIKKQPECFLWSHNRWKYTPADSTKK